MRISDSSLKQLSRLTSLEVLNLYNVRSITVEGLKNLPTTVQSVYTEVATDQAFPFRIINYRAPPAPDTEMEDT